MTIVLVYHRISADGWRYSVSREHFRQQLDVLQSEVDTVPLAWLDHTPARGHARPRVAITFDDGYRDNVTDAWPLLAERAMPATFFIVSGHVGRAREFWWDELDALLGHPGRRTNRLELRIGGESRTWALDNARNDDAAGETRTYADLHAMLKTSRLDEQQAVLHAIADALGVEAEPRVDRLPLSGDQLQHLARSDLAEIGAHTVGHVLLSACARDVQRDEIDQSKRDLEAMTGRRVSSFSYPYGMYTPDTIVLVAHAGFARACKVANRPAIAASPFTIPRFTAMNWAADEFAERLHQVVTHPW